ncbi:MAG: hypothetical protein AAGJ46_08555 [Planctomycetota bacterium]
MMKRYFVRLAAVAVVGLAPTLASAAVITDNFADGALDDSTGGINWYAINGFVGNDDSDPANIKPRLRIEDDAGLMGGNAVAVEARGSNSELMGVIGQPFALGSAIGDKVVLSFDFRIEGSNLGGDLRFGLYEDTDNEFGQGGWGESDGDFDNNNPGVRGDTGFYLRVPLQPNGDSARINDEGNVNNILGGSGDADFIARPDAGQFTGINDNLKHTLTFTVERTGPGDNDLEMLLELDNQSFGGSDGTNTIPSALTYDYFVIMTTSDTDWRMDNFQLRSVPEPSSLFLMACAAPMARRRTRRLIP